MSEWGLEGRERKILTMNAAAATPAVIVSIVAISAAVLVRNEDQEEKVASHEYLDHMQLSQDQKQEVRASALLLFRSVACGQNLEIGH